MRDVVRMKRNRVQAEVSTYFSIFILVFIASYANAETCEFGFFPYNVSNTEIRTTVCSRVFTGEMAWDQAQSLCRATYSHLASKINASLFSELKDAGIEYIWLGIRRKSGFFVTEYPAELFRERTKPTSDNIGLRWIDLKRKYDCVALHVLNRTLKTEDCETKLPFACDHGRSSKDIPKDFLCPVNWVLSTHLSSSGRRCVHLFEPRKYSQAKLSCRKSRSRIASPLEYDVLNTDDWYIPTAGNDTAYWTNQKRNGTCMAKMFYASDRHATQFQPENCEITLPFICVKDFYHNDLEVWISPEKIDLYPTGSTCTVIPDLFTCNVKANGKLISGREKNLMYQWYKDGIPIAANAYVFRMSFFPNPLKRNPSSPNAVKDGRYHCEVRLAGSLATYSSDTLDFYHPDIATYTVNVVESSPEQTLDYSQEGFRKFWDSQYRPSIENFMAKVKSLFPRKTWDLKNITWSNGISSIKFLLHIFRSNPKYSSDEEVYSHLKRLLTENKHLFEKEENYVSLSLHSADVCFAEDAAVDKSCTASFQWSTSRVSDVVNPNPLCMDDNWNLVKRRCSGGEEKAVWRPFNCSECKRIQQPVPDLPYQCSEGYAKITHQNLCYKIYADAKTWEEARSTCAEHSGYLMNEIVDDLGKSSLNSFWMPLRYFYGKIQWIGRKPKTDKWLNIFISEGGPEQHCVAAELAGHDHILKLKNCKKKLPFVCVKEPYELLSFTKVSTEWIQQADHRSCYFFGDHDYTWTEANSACKSMPFGAHLLDGIQNMQTYRHFKLLMHKLLGDRKDADCLSNTWWMNLVYKDKNPSDLQYVDWSPYVTFKTRYAGALVLLPPSKISWTLDDVSQKHKYICEIANCANLRPGQTYIEDRSQSDVISSNLTAVLNAFKLKCISTGWHVRNSIQWYKDGILVNSEMSEFTLPLTSPSAIEALRHQGYYCCSFDQIKPMGRVYSPSVLFRLPGYHTYALALKSRHEDHLSSCMDFILSEFAPAKQDYFLLKCATDTLKNSLNFFNLEIRNISCLGDEVDIGIHLHFKEEDGSEQAILHKIRNFDFRSLLPSCKVEPDAFVRSTVMCSRERTVSDHAILVWPATAMGRIAYPEELCVTEMGTLLARKCVGDFNYGAAWEPSPLSECRRKNSDRTEKLYELLQLQVKSRTSTELNDTLLKLTSEANQLAPVDVQISSLLLSSIARKSAHSPDNFGIMINTVDNLIEVPRDVILKATNASRQIIESLEIAASVVNVGAAGFHRSANNIGVHISPLAAASSEIPNCAIFRSTEIRILVNATSKDLRFHTNSSKAGIMLPTNVLSEKRNGGSDRMVYIIHQNFDYIENVEVLSPVIQASIGGSAVYDIEPPVEMYFQMPKDVYKNSSLRCVYWDQRLNENYGGWSSKGCFTKRVENSFVTCYCNHLTSFAIILDMSLTPILLQHKVALSLITYVGCCLSCFGLGMVILTFICFREWRKSVKNKALFNLSASLMFFLILFMTGINQTKAKVWCTVISAVLHYLLLSSFAWMLVSAYMMYLSLVKVLPTYIPCLIQKAAAFAWGVPTVIVVTIVSFNHELYYNGQHCWLSSDIFYYAIAIPVLSMLLANFLIFGLIMYANTCGKSNTYLRSNQDRRKLAIARAKALFCISILLGLSWIFGFLAIGKAKLIFQYLFALTTTSQGFFIFLFFIVRQRFARNLWITCIFPSAPAEKSRTYNTGTGTSHKIHYTAEL